MQTLKVGFIGSGFIAQFMALAMKQVRQLELAAIYKRSGAEELAGFARNNGLGDCRLYNTIKEVCEQSDVVAILSPNYTRVAVMEEIAEAVYGGAELKGIICEKPLGRNIAEARRMVNLADELQLPTSYFENQLFMNAINRGLEQLRPQMESMGNIVLAQSTEEHSGPHKTWFWDPVKQGGGVLSDMGCHSIASCRYMLTPPGKSPSFMEPVSVQADTCLLKWGQPKYRKELKERYGVDYSKTPAEDFCSGIITFRNPESDQLVKAQFTNSWMYDKQGLRITMNAIGPGYGMEFNTLQSPLEIFIGDAAAEAAADTEKALEKSTSSRGLLTVQPNEADLYGYTAELVNMRDSFLKGTDGYLNWKYGLEITWLCQATYMAAERGETIDLTDSGIRNELESYKSLISQGKGAEVLLAGRVRGLVD